MLGEALSLAARGWPVFPCHPNDKRPLTPGADKDADGAPIDGTGGLYFATTDEAQIHAWWRQWPEAMIGLPTGDKIGTFVLDLDPKDGETPEGLLTRLQAACALTSLPPAPMVRTPRGGLHLYFAMPDGVPIGNRANAGAEHFGLKGIDVRGTGGYVIAPASIRKGPKAVADGCDGIAYSWEADSGLDDFDPPQAPPALIAFVTNRDFGAPERPQTSRHTQSNTSPAAPEDARAQAVRRFALAALDSESAAGAGCGQGGRNDQLNRSAFVLGQLVAAGALSESVCIATLEEAAGQCGLTKDDGIRSVRATIRSGLRDGMKHPRDLSDVGARAGRGRGNGNGSSRPNAPMPDANDTPRPGTPKGDGKRDVRGSHDAARSGGGGGRDNGPGDAGGGDDDGDEPDWEVIAQCAAEPQNDIGNARRLIAHFGHDMIRVRDVGEHYWAGTHWESQGGAEAFQRFAQTTGERIALEALTIEPSKADKDLIHDIEPLKGRPSSELSDTEREILKAGMEAEGRLAKRRSDRRKFSISCGNSNRISGMITQAMPHITVAPDDLDRDPLAINVMNGTVRLVKEEVREAVTIEETFNYVPRTRWRVRLDEHRREDRIAKVLPVTFDQDAKAPKWAEFMERFQPKEDYRRFLQQFHGYALTGMAGEQIFVFNYGLGANGKSTFMEAIARLMGGYARTLPAEALTGDAQRNSSQASPEFARLPGARLVRCSEMPRGQNFRDSTLKMLTGGEAMLVRHNYGNFFEFTPVFKAIGSGNDRPSIGGVDEGIWRRMRLVPWEVTIPAAERRPMERVLGEFAAEGSGVLNWLLEGAVAYLEQGLKVPAGIQAATDSYRDDMDPVGEFTRACVVPTPGEDVTARDMYLAYTAWCHTNSVKLFAEKGFAAIMVQKGFEKESGRIRKYKNLRLHDVPDDPEVKDKYSRGGGDWAG